MTIFLKFDYNVCVSASEHFSPPFNSSYKLAFEIKCLLGNVIKFFFLFSVIENAHTQAT